MANPSPITLQQLFRYYRALPHQAAAICELEQDLAANGYAAAMRRDRPWFSSWSQDGKQDDAAPAARPTNPLTGFPYFSQLDNQGGTGYRECQTSAIAMCLAYLGAGGITSDDQYRAIVRRHGDTTSQAAHQAALAELGVKARFVTSGNAGILQAEIKAGYPAAIGILQHGTPFAPNGGGHWIAAYGFDPFGWIVNDPYGELDLVAGSWVQQGSSSGKGLRYSYRNLNPRWQADGPGTGWAWLFS